MDQRSVTLIYRIRQLHFQSTSGTLVKNLMEQAFTYIKYEGIGGTQHYIDQLSVPRVPDNPPF